MRKNNPRKGWHTFRVAGYATKVVSFAPGICKCAHIGDGVAFDNGYGYWIISYDDLMEMARLATAARSGRRLSSELAKGGAAAGE